MATTIAAITVTAVAALAGCTPAPAPTPTPTAAFASEEEAFAAAEEVYRAYNDALNERRAGKTDADPQRYLVGTALEGDIDAQNSLNAHGLRIEGRAEVISFIGESAELRTEDSRLLGIVCIDVSGVALVNDANVDVTPPERGDTVAQLVTFSGSKMSLVISHEATAEASSC